MYKLDEGQRIGVVDHIEAPFDCLAHTADEVVDSRVVFSPVRISQPLQTYLSATDMSARAAVIVDMMVKRVDRVGRAKLTNTLGLGL